ncbi:Bacteriocin immunity protein [Bacillus pseudomycoides]
MLKFIQEKLALIGTLCLFIITIVNYTINNETITGIVSISLFILVLILYIISRNTKVS